jgi:hypothetical protein
MYQAVALAARFFFGLGAKLAALPVCQRDRAAPCSVRIGANRAFTIAPSLAWHAAHLPLV